MKATVLTDSFLVWLENKSSCPSCKAKDKFIASGHDFVELVAYLKCYKCGHVWDEVPLKD